MKDGARLLLLVITAGLVVLRAGASFAVQLPRTEQVRCFDSKGSEVPCPGTGQDGDIQSGLAWPEPRHLDNGNQTIIDSMTGLTWTKNANSPGPAECGPGVPMKWQEALDFVACLNTKSYLGFNDWRLPNINELDSLVYTDATWGWVREQPFEDLQHSYWTSTTYAFNPKVSWNMNLISGSFILGAIKTYSNDEALIVWPVRGASSGPARLWKTGQRACHDSAGEPADCEGTGQDGELRSGARWPKSRFVEQGACLTDTLTGLTWVKKPDTVRRTWQQSLQYANDLTLCGHSDWRLPNIRELRSLVNYKEKDNAAWLKRQGFDNLLAHVYWSSTTYWCMSPFFAFFMDSWSGGVFGLPKCYGFYALPVRGGLVRPQNLAATATGSKQIVVSWRYGSDKEKGFELERKAGACYSENAWEQIAKVAAGVNNHVDGSGISEGSEYAYRVRAYNSSGGSEYSECGSATTSLAGTPQAPTGLEAVSVSSGKIKVTWKDNSDNEDRFSIYRKAGSGDWTMIHTTEGPNIKAFSDASAEGNSAETPYSYYVTSCNTAGCSPATNAAAVPFKPLGLKAAAKGKKAIQLTWKDMSGNETGFSLERKDGDCSGKGWKTVGTTAENITKYADGDVAKGNSYSYRVRAVARTPAMPYAGGESQASACRTAVAP